MDTTAQPSSSGTDTTAPDALVELREAVIDAADAFFEVNSEHDDHVPNECPEFIAAVDRLIEAARHEASMCVCPTFDGVQARSFFCPRREHVAEAYEKHSATITDLTARLKAAEEHLEAARANTTELFAELKDANAAKDALADALRVVMEQIDKSAKMGDPIEFLSRDVVAFRAALAGQPTSCPNQQRVDEVMKIVDEAERRVNLLSEALRTLIDSDEYLIHARTECDCYAHNGARAALHEAPTGGEGDE